MRRQISEVVKKEQGDGGGEARTPYIGGTFLGAGKRNTHSHAHKSTHKHTYAHMSTHVHARERMLPHTQAHLCTHEHTCAHECSHTHTSIHEHTSMHTALRAELANSTCSRHRMSPSLSTGLPLVSRSLDQWAEYPPCLSSSRYHARSKEAK